MADHQKSDLNDLIEPLRKLTGIDFAMGEDGLPHYEGDLTQEQESRLRGVAGLDVIDVDVFSVADGKGKAYSVTNGNADRLAYLAMRNDEYKEGLPVEDFEKVDKEWFVSGDVDEDDPDVLEEKRRKRREQYEKFHQAGAGFGAVAAGAENDESDKGLDADDEGGNSRTLLGKAGHYFALGVESRKHGVKAQSMDGKVSDRQLKAMIKIGVLEKGYDTLYFYDRSSKKINPEVTARAQDMIVDMQRRGELPEGISVSSKPQDVKPWNYFFRTPAKEWADFKDRFTDRKNKIVDPKVSKINNMTHNWGWEKPLKSEFAKAHDNKTGQGHTHTAHKEAVAGQNNADNIPSGAGPA